jgi:hypothetical protein
VVAEREGSTVLFTMKTSPTRHVAWYNELMYLSLRTFRLI